MNFSSIFSLFCLIYRTVLRFFILYKRMYGSQNTDVVFVRQELALSVINALSRLFHILWKNKAVWPLYCVFGFMTV